MIDNSIELCAPLSLRPALEGDELGLAPRRRDRVVQFNLDVGKIRNASAFRNDVERVETRGVGNIARQPDSLKILTAATCPETLDERGCAIMSKLLARYFRLDVERVFAISERETFR